MWQSDSIQSKKTKNYYVYRYFVKNMKKTYNVKVAFLKKEIFQWVFTTQYLLNSISY